MGNRNKQANICAGYLSPPNRLSCGPVVMSGWDREAYENLYYSFSDGRSSEISIKRIFPITRGFKNPIIPDHNSMPELLEKFSETGDLADSTENLEQIAEADVQPNN